MTSTDPSTFELLKKIHALQVMIFFVFNQVCLKNTSLNEKSILHASF